MVPKVLPTESAIEPEESALLEPVLSVIVPLANALDVPVLMFTFPEPELDVRVLSKRAPEMEVAPVPALPVTTLTEPPLFDLVDAPADIVMLPPAPPVPALSLILPPVPVEDVPVEIVTLPVDADDVPVSM